MRNADAYTHEIAGHLVFVDNYDGGKYVNIAEKRLRVRKCLPHPVCASSSVEKPTPLEGNEHKTRLECWGRNLHRLVDPKSVGLFIPTVRVIGRGVVGVQANRSILVKRRQKAGYCDRAGPHTSWKNPIRLDDPGPLWARSTSGQRRARHRANRSGPPTHSARYSMAHYCFQRARSTTRGCSQPPRKTGTDSFHVEREGSQRIGRHPSSRSRSVTSRREIVVAAGDPQEML